MNKKIIHIGAMIFIWSMLSTIHVPLNVHAQNTDFSNTDTAFDSKNPYCQGDECGIQPGIDATKNELSGNVSTTTNARALIFGWIQFGLGFIFLIAVVGIIYAGVLYITSFNNEGNRQKATKLIIAILTGIIIILIAYALVTTVINAVRG